MKHLLRHTSLLMLAMALALVATACSHSHYDGEDEDDAGQSDKMLLVLHISPVNATNATANGGVAEKIKSLRVIVLNKAEGETSYKIERNSRISNLHTTDANLFSYSYSWSTEPGTKKFYVIANEESVEDVKYKGGTKPSSWPTGSNGKLGLRELLSNYKEGDDATTFEKEINKIYFSPQYTTGNNVIYLPYTSFYDGFKVEKTGLENKTTDIPTIYLVPVATKFTFEFINKRKQAVEIDDITVSSVNEDNFLMAQVGSTDYTKTFADDKQKYYWIDWLAKVAELSHSNEGFSDNMAFNEKYGWISDYTMPSATLKKAVMISSDNAQTIPAPIDENTPGGLTLGPFYWSEGKKEETYKDANNKDVTEQIYRLTLGLHDQGVTERPPFEDVQISNLKALFRDTHVKIKVTLSDGDVEVYAEIQDWDIKHAMGWVTGG